MSFEESPTPPAHIFLAVCHSLLPDERVPAATLDCASHAVYSGLSLQRFSSLCFKALLSAADIISILPRSSLPFVWVLSASGCFLFPVAADRSRTEGAVEYFISFLASKWLSSSMRYEVAFMFRPFACLFRASLALNYEFGSKFIPLLDEMEYYLLTISCWDLWFVTKAICFW